MHLTGLGREESDFNNIGATQIASKADGGIASVFVQRNATSPVKPTKDLLREEPFVSFSLDATRFATYLLD